MKVSIQFVGVVALDHVKSMSLPWIEELMMVLLAQWTMLNLQVKSRWGNRCQNLREE